MSIAHAASCGVVPLRLTAFLFFNVH